MKRFVLAALAATTMLTGAAAASAMPLHIVGHGPVLHGPVLHGPGPIHFPHPGPGPIHFPHPVGFPHPTPIGFPHPGPIGGGPVWWHGPHPGWGYHGWGFGAFLPVAYLSPAYFVVDFVDYGLAPPPANYEWVQDGPNALLVNLNTAQVVEVVPNAFA
jgi:hypothetical protein